MHLAEALLNFAEFIDIVDKLSGFHHFIPLRIIPILPIILTISPCVSSKTFSAPVREREFRSEPPKDNGIRYLLIESLMDSLHLRSIPVYDNCEKLNAPMVDSRYSRLREFVLREEERPVGRHHRRPRWQLKFHFNPEFPQYFSIPRGLVVLSVVSRRWWRRRRAESLHSRKRQGEERRCNDGENKAVGRGQRRVKEGRQKRRTWRGREVSERRYEE